MRTPTLYSARSGRKLGRDTLTERAALAVAAVDERLASFAASNPAHAKRAFITLRRDSRGYIASLRYSSTQGTTTVYVAFA